jgi:AcrR family transcriptional regulator
MLQATLALLAEVGFEAMSIEAIAARAGVGKTTIYRRYSGKEELVADAIESIREEMTIPDTGSLSGDINALIENAAQTVLSPLGRQATAMIVGSAASNHKFAHIYWEKYLKPRREAFSVVIERAKVRNEVETSLDAGLVFDAMSAVMLYARLFQPANETWEHYVQRAVSLFLSVPLA